MELSYWEYRTWFSDVDFTIVGSGIVGLSTAIFLRQRFPSAKILVLEKGILPQGASTKNAGFACFGSISEIVSDLKTHTATEVLELVQKRFDGIQLLRELLGDATMDLQFYGGHELFLEGHTELFDNCQDRLAEVNALLDPVFGEAPYEIVPNRFGFQNIKGNYITHKFEGQLHTGKMMKALLEKAQANGVLILNSITVEGFTDTEKGVAVQTAAFWFNTKKMIVATNGFASKLLEENVSPARAQVLITQPIKDLQLRGTFHLDEGFYYFRNIEHRIMLGGGRNLDIKSEETTEFGQTEKVQAELERLLKEVILPQTDFRVEHRWSGIMGVGKQKRPIVKQCSTNVYCGVRLGGMGVAIGSLVGKELAAMI